MIWRGIRKAASAFLNMDPFGPGPRPAIVRAVAVNIRVGFVKTAHFVKAAKGALEWSRPTP